MATINARSPFQIYKLDNPEATVQDFNGLPNEASLPYKILASEEALAASLDVVEASEDHKTTYAISTIHNAFTYLTQLASYLPLMSRSQNAKKLAIRTELLLRTIMLYSENDKAMFDLIHTLVAESDPTSDTVSITALTNVESAISQLEKRYREEAKTKGVKIELLRKVTAPVSVSSMHGGCTPLKGTPPLPGGHSGEDRETSAHKREGDVEQEEPNSDSRRRRRSSASQAQQEESDGVGDGSGDAAQEPRLKDARQEGAGGAPATGATAAKRPQTARRAKGPAMLIVGRLRALTNGEKKVVAILNQMIDILGRVYANKYNDLVPIFDHLLDRLRVAQGIMDAERTAFGAREDKKPPEPFHESTLEGVFAALADATQTFRDDDDCRLELDEDLLHPIAHACLTAINQIEGYDTVPYQEPSEEDKRKKQAARDSIKAKRDEAARKIMERAKAREELAQKKEEEKRLLRARLGGGVDEDELEDDGKIKNPVPIGYVHYDKSLPLESTELFEKALFVWSMMVSVPQALMLSQMPFSVFIKGLLEEDQDANGLMEEITNCLLEVTIEHVRVTSPGTPRIATRGKNWFDALVEFVGIASGNKKKRQQQRRRAPSTTSEEDNSDDEGFSDDSSDSDSTTTSSEEEEEEEEVGEKSDGENHEAAVAGGSTTEAGSATDAAGTGTTAAADASKSPLTNEQAEEEEEDTDSFSAELKATVERIAGLRSLATWGNVDMADRLNLLQFCVLEALASDPVVAEADKLFKQHEDDVTELEKQVKEIREDAEKEMRGILKSLSATPDAAGTASSTPISSPTTKLEGKGGVDKTESYEEKKARILANADKRRATAYANYFSKQDGLDIGAVIQPIGMDRYKRLYWRFPLDRRILVQTTAATAPEVPVVPEPIELRKLRMGGSLFLDDEQEEEVALIGSNRRRGLAAPGPSTKTKLGSRSGGTEDEEQVDETGQRTWGVIPAEYVTKFAETLDPRGQREALLRKSLGEMAAYVASMEEPHDGRATRSRARTFGYLNKLKQFL